MYELKKINLYKVKPYVSFDEFLIGDLSGYGHIQDTEGTYEGYIKYEIGGGEKKSEEQISWLVFLNKAFDEPKYRYEAYNRYPRALLALKIQIEDKNHFYMLTFGSHADSLLDKSCIVHDFGIKVGMNICDVDGLLRVQTARHDSISQQLERQASTGTSFSAFDINNEAEFLKTIAGHVKEEYKDIVDSFNNGKNNISLNFKKKNALTWRGLIEICIRLEERYQSKDYRNTVFKGYDNLHAESDPEIIERLDEILCENIKNKTFDKIHMAPPEFLHQDFSYAYKDSGQNSLEGIEIYDDLSIADFIDKHPRRVNLCAKTLKTWKIYVCDGQEEKIFPKWNAYECLVAEIDREGKTYILSNGQWKKFSDELRNKIASYFRNNNDLKVDTDCSYLLEGISIFDEKKGQDREEVYNSYVARSSEDVYLLDKARCTINGEKRYEICDLLHCKKHLVHVKRYSSGSVSVNHVFTQGKVYSHAFSTEETCRADMREWVNIIAENKDKDQSMLKQLIPEKNNETYDHDYYVIFCILHDSESFGLKDLPLMTQYELMNAHNYLTQDRKFRCGIVFRKVKLGKNGLDELSVDSNVEEVKDDLTDRVEHCEYVPNSLDSTIKNDVMVGASGAENI